MPLESDNVTSTQRPQADTPDATEQTAEPFFAASVNRRGLMKVVGGGILGALAVQEALAPAPLAATPLRKSSPESPRTQTAAPTAGVAGVFDVKAFGATGDGKTIDTQAINNAIDAASSAGGGTVRFPAGTYASFSIHLKSNVQLYIGPGATILAAETPATPGAGAAYDTAEPNTQWEAFQDYGHNHFHNSLIWGESVENVSITGPGLIWGKNLSKGYGPGPKAESAGVGNKSIALKLCRNITLRDFSILQGGHFGILATGVDNLTIDALRIDTNRDGMDIDCCRNVRISNCSVNSPWDDAIVLKSSYALGSAISCDDVTITNCFVCAGYQLGTLLDGTWKPFAPGERTFKTGRIKCGTESNGGFRNITISNCVFDNCQGLALESVDGAMLEDISITNITMRDVSSAPIFLRLGRRMRGPAGAAIGVLRRVNISNVVVSNSASKLCSLVLGIPDHVIEDVKFSNIFIQHQGGGTADDAAFVPAEDETVYPEPGRFQRMPANGFYIRHAKNVELRDVEIRAIAADARPTFGLVAVDGAEFFNVRGPENVPVFALENVTDFRSFQSKRVPDTELDS
ncbi:MAG: glycoside hydrolase family 28 protein, partial [Candidatus Acidiferrales bacterium]